MKPQIKIPAAERKKLRDEAKTEPKVIASFLPFLKECVRWKLPLRVVLDSVRINSLAAATRLYDDSEGQIGIKIDVEDMPLWVEIDPTALDSNIPVGFKSKDVVVTPESIDEQGNLTPAVTRRRKWSEARMLAQRGSRYFAPASDGERYFSIDKIKKLEGKTGVLGFIEPDNLPAVA